MKKSELKTLNKFFGNEYDFIYTAEEQNKAITNYYKALDHFDHSLTAAEKIILTDFVNYRQDLVSSDRECVAFVFALDDYYEMLVDNAQKARETV